jgi:hypothetical protein
MHCAAAGVWLCSAHSLGAKQPLQLRDWRKQQPHSCHQRVQRQLNRQLLHLDGRLHLAAAGARVCGCSAAWAACPLLAASSACLLLFSVVLSSVCIISRKDLAGVLTTPTIQTRCSRMPPMSHFMLHAFLTFPGCPWHGSRLSSFESCPAYGLSA